MYNILLRRENLIESLKYALKDIPVSVKTDDRTISVCLQELLISGVAIEDEVYRIFNVSSEWMKKTTYTCNEAEDGTWFYYLDSLDECIGEMQRLILFEATKGKKMSPIKKFESELSCYVTIDKFEKAYREFLNQADKNKISKKAQGSKKPVGFEHKNIFDGGDFGQHFGQGAASKTPYLNWWVVSIYYITDLDEIVMGIEVKRYDYLNKMKPLRIEQIGNKKVDVAVFYSASKNNVNYSELYKKFIEVSEEVMKLGLK